MTATHAAEPAPADTEAHTASIRARSQPIPTWVLGLGLVAVHLLVAFQVRPNPRWNDALFVLNDARDYPNIPGPVDHHQLRIGNLFPARFFLDLFGYGQWAYYAWPLLMGILLVLATFALGTILFGRGVGAAAGLLVVFHPVLVTTEIRFGEERMASWHLLPDIPSTAFFVLGIALLIRAAQRRDVSSWWFVGAGLCFGWAYLIRELTVFVFPVIAIVLILWRQPLRRWAQVAVPMLGCLALELLNGALVYGDPLVRLHIGAEHSFTPSHPVSHLDAILRLPRVIIGYPQTLAVMATLVLLLVGPLVVRRRTTALLLAWFLSLWVPLTVFSGFLHSDSIKINASLMRYWIPVLPVMCIAAAAVVGAGLAWLRGHAPERLRTASAVASVIVVALLLAAWIVPQLRVIVDNPQDAKWNAVRVWLHDNDADVGSVITDDRDALTLAIYAHKPIGGDRAWDARILTLPHGQLRAALPAATPGAALLWTPELSRHPPRAGSGWEVVLRAPQLRLYRAGVSQ